MPTKPTAGRRAADRTPLAVTVAHLTAQLDAERDRRLRAEDRVDQLLEQLAGLAGTLARGRAPARAQPVPEVDGLERAERAALGGPPTDTLPAAVGRALGQQETAFVVRAERDLRAQGLDPLTAQREARRLSDEAHAMHPIGG